MKLRSLIGVGLYVFLVTLDAGAMSFNEQDNPSNFQYSNRMGSVRENPQYSDEANNAAAAECQYSNGDVNAVMNTQDSHTKSDLATEYQYPSGADNTTADYLYSDKRNGVSANSQYPNDNVAANSQYPNDNGNTAAGYAAAKHATPDYRYHDRRNDAANYRHSKRRNNPPGNYQHSSRSTAAFRSLPTVSQLKEDMNSQMLKFHRIIQSFEADIPTQTLALRHHLWMLEELVKNQVERQINGYISASIAANINGSTSVDIEKQFTGLHWPQWSIESEWDEPLFRLRWNVRQFQELFHSSMDQITQNVEQLRRKNAPLSMDQITQNVEQLRRKNASHKNKAYDTNKFQLNRDIEQFNMAVDEHLFGLHNDIKRLESVLEEQIFGLNQDVSFLKSEIDISWIELEGFMASKLGVSRMDLRRSVKSDVYTSWQTLYQYVKCLEVISNKNILGLNQEVGFLKTVIYEDVSFLHQCARTLQANVCGEFSYKYNRFLIRK